MLAHLTQVWITLIFELIEEYPGKQYLGPELLSRPVWVTPLFEDYSVFWKRHQTPRQQEITLQQSRFLSEQNLIRSGQFERGPKIFLLGVTPTVGQLIDHTCAVRTQLPTHCRPLGNSMAVAHAEQAAWQSVFHELSTLTANGS